MKLSKYNIRCDRSIENWDEALPLGNGKIGCLIYGKGPVRFALDRVDLWDTRPNPITQERGFCFSNLVKLAKSGKQADWAEYTRLFDEVVMEKAYPTKITAGRLILDFGKEDLQTFSEVDLQTAVATINGSEHTFSIETFLSATEYVGVARLHGDYRLNIHIPFYLSGDENGNAENRSGIGAYQDGCLRYPRARVVREGEFLYYVQKTYTDFSFGIVALQKKCGDFSEVYYTIATSNDHENFIEEAKKELERVSHIGYETLKREHVAWWKRYWRKSEISIGDKLLEKTYYRSWYLFASCSRKGFYPMPLQGVWTADNDNIPPWKGDYHHDTNTELSYQAYLKANRLEEGRVFIDYLWDLKKQFERFAKDFYGVNGLLLPSCSTIDGKPMGGWAQYSLSPTMTIWAAQSFDEYWLYTGDKKFLKERAYPFLKEVGEAIYGLLEEKGGKLYLPLSSSPEIYDNEQRAYLTPNSNFDLALLRYLYKTLQGYAEVLQESDAGYATILDKLDEIAVDGDGVILLDKTQRLPESHRHFSHVLALYPLHLINYDTKKNKRIYENTLLHLEQLGTGWWVGFSFAMSAQLYAMAHNGNAAYEKLRIFAKGFVADNGFHLNGDFKNCGFSQWHYRPFTLEGLFGYCDALQEMLLQEHQSYLDIFPAVPTEWLNKLSFKKLRSYNGVLVSARAERGKVVQVELVLPCNMELRIKNVFQTSRISCLQNKARSILTEKDGYFIIHGKKGKILLKR